jgi:hypothetical protein
MILARWIERAFGVAVQCPHDADAREHRRPAERRDRAKVNEAVRDCLRLGPLRPGRKTVTASKKT